MVDVEVGGRIIVYTQFSISEDDPPFRVTLDPPIGNLNQLLAIKINFMIGQAFKELPDMCDNNLVHIRGPASNLYAAYSDLNSKAATGLYELLNAYIHVKTPFRIIYDVVYQFEDHRNASEPTNTTVGLEREKAVTLKTYSDTIK